jgi:hypothetical protein
MLIDAGLLGYFTLFLLFWVVSFVVYKYFFVKSLSKKGNPSYKKNYKILRKIHPAFASAAIILGSYHGYLMLGGFRIHTGTLIIISLIYMLLTFLSGKTKSLRTKWRTFHKAGGIVTVAAIFVHYFFPWII